MALSLYHITTTKYWFLVNLIANITTPEIGKDFMAVDFDIRTPIPIYHLIDDQKLYVVFSNFSITWTAFYMNQTFYDSFILDNHSISSNIEYTESIAELINKPVVFPDPSKIEETLLNIPNNKTLPKHVKDKFIEKYSSQFTSPFPISDLPSLTNG
nr:hypothetical protein [Abalone asfa-like virus]